MKELPEVLLEDLNFYAGLEVVSAYRQFDPLSSKQNNNVWLGGAGCIAHTHFDSYENLNAQLYGRKHWLLFPPNQYRNLHMYPYLHPSYAQAQVTRSHLRDPLSSQTLTSFPSWNVWRPTRLSLKLATSSTSRLCGGITPSFSM